MTKNTCECPNPPGGRVVCRQDQLAICRVRDGRVESECIDPPSGDFGRTDKQRNTAVRNWALSVITDTERTSYHIFTAQDHSILSEGTYFNRDTGELVTFSLPISMKTGSMPVEPLRRTDSRLLEHFARTDSMPVERSSMRRTSWFGRLGSPVKLAASAMVCLFFALAGWHLKQRIGTDYRNYEVSIRVNDERGLPDNEAFVICEVGEIQVRARNFDGVWECNIPAKYKHHKIRVYAESPRGHWVGQTEPELDDVYDPIVIIMPDEVHGFVMDESGNPLEGVEIYAVGQRSELDTVTDALGRFSFQKKQSEKFPMEFVARKKGYDTIEFLFGESNMVIRLRLTKIKGLGPT